MKKIHLLAIAFLASISLLFSGCQKLFDQIQQHPGQGGSQYCAIKKIIFTRPTKYPYSGQDTLDISYNASGDPISAIPKHTDENEPKYYFRYDNKHRLTDLIGIFENGIYRSWQRYFYDTHNRVILDSVYDYPEEENGHPITGLLGTVTTASYDYDPQGRIIKITKYPIDADDITIINTYDYNAAGNLTGYTYDNKVNIHQVNKVWMFLGRDYSVNNQVSGENLSVSYQYNSIGLPTRITASQGEINFIVSGTGDGFSFSDCTIVYDCINNENLAGAQP